MLSAEEMRHEVEARRWFHSIDLGQGIVTPGTAEPPVPVETLPTLSGRSVLDIGAWDGYYSFLAEREGAARVVALDHYVWGVDFARRGAYWQECFDNGTLPDHERDTTDFWQPDLPGRASFEFAHQVLESKVEPVLGDFTTIDLSQLGTFDVVLCLGVLYHVKEPLTLLERLRATATDVAVIETEAVHFEGHDEERLLRFHAGGDLHVDFGNWYVPTIGALHALCRAAGFSRVETAAGPPAPPPAPGPASLRQRVGRRLANVAPPGPPSAPSTRYRAVVRAYV